MPPLAELGGQERAVWVPSCLRGTWPPVLLRAAAVTRSAEPRYAEYAVACPGARRPSDER